MKQLVFLTLLLLFLGCQSQTKDSYVYNPPPELADDLQTGTLTEVGLDSVPIIKAVNKIGAGRFGEIHSLLLYKEGKLVLEEYFPGHIYQWDGPRHHGKLVNWDRDMSHSIMSDTKSITSVCIGVAVDKGFIADVDQSIFDYLPEHQHLARDGKEHLTIEHLLTMTPGLEWEEWNAPYSSLENPIIGIWYSEMDPVSHILSGNLVRAPGSGFAYYGGSQILLGEILKNATGMPIDEFSQQYLWEPLNIENANWSVRFENGVIESAGGLKLKPRDMLKVGITYLDEGVWNGEQIVSSAWVAKSRIPYKSNTGIKVPGETSRKQGYSYSWWINPLEHQGEQIEAYHAGGWGGQKIIVIPPLKTVIVFTGGNYTGRVPQFRIVEKYLLPAIDEH
ncbi:serine hydrolase domain-containing protein [Poritiphilus flavus]|uniref:Serine hydrolase n=1 Tax=Poritiphilus flavus TaxID=2697053 RepID=A0A6L9EE76_9FLAO|nr:serine hydrolase [Poritiphilus flavus]NAS13040.1 serine hydrolase [Poritiphilus flavus]